MAKENPKDFGLSRRQLLQLIGAATARVALSPDSFLPKNSVLDIFGIQLTTSIGGGADPKLSCDLAAESGARHVKVINPDQDVLEVLSQANEGEKDKEGLIVRLYSSQIEDDGRINHTFFDEATTLEVMANINGQFTDGQTPVAIQAFNEPNLTNETGGQFLMPEEHIREHFIPTAEMLIDNGFLVITSPVAPDSDTAVSDIEYARRQFLAIRNQKGARWAKNFLGVGAQAYTFYPGDNPFRHPRLVLQVAREVFGFTPPLYILEGGPNFPNREPDEKSRSAEVTRLLSLYIPSDLSSLACFTFFVLSNLFNRQDVDPTRRIQDGDLTGMEDHAWIKLRWDHQTNRYEKDDAVFKDVLRMVRNRNLPP